VAHWKRPQVCHDSAVAGAGAAPDEGVLGPVVVGPEPAVVGADGEEDEDDEAPVVAGGAAPTVTSGL
jgi:hypothetical protein